MISVLNNNKGTHARSFIDGNTNENPTGILKDNLAIVIKSLKVCMPFNPEIPLLRTDPEKGKVQTTVSKCMAKVLITTSFI